MSLIWVVAVAERGGGADARSIGSSPAPNSAAARTRSSSPRATFRARSGERPRAVAPSSLPSAACSRSGGDAGDSPAGGAAGGAEPARTAPVFGCVGCGGVRGRRDGRRAPRGRGVLVACARGGCPLGTHPSPSMRARARTLLADVGARARRRQRRRTRRRRGGRRTPRMRGVLVTCASGSCRSRAHSYPRARARAPHCARALRARAPCSLAHLARSRAPR
jgi:hypothetical protein